MEEKEGEGNYGKRIGEESEGFEFEREKDEGFVRLKALDLRLD